MSALLFYFLAGITLIPALAVVLSRNLFHSGLSLIVSFLGVAGIYVTLYAPFVAGMQVLVYAGAIAVILLFAFMLTHDIANPMENASRIQQGSAAVVCLLLCGAMLRLLLSSGWDMLGRQAEAVSLEQLGTSFLTTFLVPFEAISLLLLMTLVGAIVVARKEEEDLPLSPRDDLVSEEDTVS